MEANVDDNGKKTVDGTGLGLEIFESLAEAALIGTLVDIGLTAVANLPVFIVSASNAPYVALTVSAITAAVQIRRSFKRNRV